MDVSFSATPNGRAAAKDIAGNNTAIAQEVRRPEANDHLPRGGRLASAGLASRIRDLAAIALLAFAAISPLRAEPCQAPADSIQRAER